MPFFSVVIPVYNRAEFIAGTLNSVLEQTFHDYEIIVVNDGSTDRSEQIIKKLTDNTDKIKYLVQKNSERGVARNNGFRNSSGKYVVFIDSDDLMKRTHLSSLYEKIIEQSFPNFITTKYFLRRNGVDSASIMLEKLKEGYHDINLQLKGAIFACNFTVRKDNSNLKLFHQDRKYAAIEDWMFIVQNLENDQVYLIDNYSIIMIDHDNRSMRGSNQIIIMKHLLAMEWIEKNISLTIKQIKLLRGYSYHFCAIHNYVDKERMKSFKYLLRSIFLIGIDRMRASLAIKNIIGYGVIQKIK